MKIKQRYEKPATCVVRVLQEIPVLSTGDATGDNLPIETIDDLWTTVIP